MKWGIIILLHLGSGDEAKVNKPSTQFPILDLPTGSQQALGSRGIPIEVHFIYEVLSIVERNIKCSVNRLGYPHILMKVTINGRFITIKMLRRFTVKAYSQQ